MLDVVSHSCLVLVGLVFELRVSHLQNRHSTNLSHTSSPLCSSYFGDGVLQLFAQTCPQTGILLVSLPSS
jgi:hypothetical protein